MKMEPYLFNELIEDFIGKTGDSPTHILVTSKQWNELGCPKTYEHSVSCCMDYLVVENIGDYHFPVFPIVAQLPQFLHEPLKPKVLFKLGKYEIIRGS